MLNVEIPDFRSNDVIIQSLTHDPIANPLSLGCPVCAHYHVCGGLNVRASIIDCLDLCCGVPGRCSRVCRNKPTNYVQQVCEIGGYAFDNVDRTPTITIPLQHDIVPMVYHGSRRASALENEVFALRLADIVNFKTGKLRFKSRKALGEAFRIADNADIILSGVDHDYRIEPWWTLGENRIFLIRTLAELGVKIVTAPNFSVVLDHPRTDDLHALKRIALVFAEFQNAGLACALHPNGRTQQDFERWGRFISDREEVRVLAYEFITGSNRIGRKQFHLDRLAELAAQAGRDLDIIVRGDPRVIPFLRSHFRKVVYIKTNSFLKTVHRQYAERVGNRKLNWNSAPTKHNECIDKLFAHNFHEHSALLRVLYYEGIDPFPLAA